MHQAEYFQRLLQRSRAEFTRKYCLHPEAPGACSKQIISAHSVQKALLKRFISINGHVGQVKTMPQTGARGLVIKLERVGIHDATTFSGFCGKHDTVLFRPLEYSEFTFAKHQIALLGYRAICRELYGKAAEIAGADSMYAYASIQPEIVDPIALRDYYTYTQIGRHNGRSNLEKEKAAYIEMLSDDSRLRFYGVEFSNPPVYFSSVAFQPEWNFDGVENQDLGSLGQFGSICFSAWAAKDRAVAVFCWHSSADPYCVPFIESLRKIDHCQFADRILAMAFEVSDNVVFNLDWWAGLNRDCQQLLAARSPSGLSAKARRANCFADDGMRAISATVEQEHVGYKSI